MNLPLFRVLPLICVQGERRAETIHAAKFYPVCRHTFCRSKNANAIPIRSFINLIQFIEIFYGHSIMPETKMLSNR